MEIPHLYFPASFAERFFKVTVKVRLPGWSRMDTRPLLTSLLEALSVTVSENSGKHGCLHQYLLKASYSFLYRHGTLRDPPTVPVTLLGPLRDKEPGKHNPSCLPLEEPGPEGPWASGLLEVTPRPEGGGRHQQGIGRHRRRSQETPAVGF